ncbi:hypothetical protein, partial [Methyloceanibacter sp.]|uniref:hypothetical protein n=1 Tax=Methyloceanibacter sp. TaxID=1965321 RepID=UPI003C73CB76
MNRSDLRMWQLAQMSRGKYHCASPHDAADSPHAQDGLSIERSADMKTSLAIATIALTFGAMLSFTSGVSAQNYG